MATMTITDSVQTFSFEALPTVTAAQELQESLTAILEKYKGWKDPLSKKLFAWGVDVISLDLEGNGWSSQAQAKAMCLADDLARKILVNPLDDSPLTKPMIDRGRWIWDKWMLDDFRRLAPKAGSPFTNQPFDVTPHHFAWDVIEWTALFQMDSASQGKAEIVESKRAATNTEVVSTEEESVEDRAVAIASYQTRAFVYVMNQLTKTIQNLQETADEAAKTMDAFKKAQDKLSKQQAAHAEVRAKAHVDKVDATIAANEKVNAARVTVLNNNNKDLNTRLTKRTEELTGAKKEIGTLKNHVASQDQTIANLSGQVNQLRNENRRRGIECVIC